MTQHDHHAEANRDDLQPAPKPAAESSDGDADASSYLGVLDAEDALLDPWVSMDRFDKVGERRPSRRTRVTATPDGTDDVSSDSETVVEPNNLRDVPSGFLRVSPDAAIVNDPPSEEDPMLILSASADSTTDELEPQFHERFKPVSERLKQLFEKGKNATGESARALRAEAAAIVRSMSVAPADETTAEGAVTAELVEPVTIAPIPAAEADAPKEVSDDVVSLVPVAPAGAMAAAGRLSVRGEAVADPASPAVKADLTRHLDRFAETLGGLHRHLRAHEGALAQIAEEVARAVCLGGQVWVVGERDLHCFAPVVVRKVFAQADATSPVTIPAQVLPLPLGGGIRLPEEALAGDVLIAFADDLTEPVFAAQLTQAQAAGLIVAVVRPIDKGAPRPGTVDVPVPTAESGADWSELHVARVLDRMARTLVESRRDRMGG